MKIETFAARRPGRPKSSEKADAIRHAAAALFMSEGLGRTSMDAIAAAAGVSKQTVYSHFRCKDDLFRACVSEKVHLYGLDAASVDAAADLATTLAHVGRRYLTLLSDPEVIAMFRLMISEATAFPRIVATFYESGPETTRRFVAGIMERHLGQTPQAPGVADQAATDFLALVRADYFVELILGTRENVDTDEIERRVRHTLAQLRPMYPMLAWDGAGTGTVSE